MGQGDQLDDSRRVKEVLSVLEQGLDEARGGRLLTLDIGLLFLRLAVGVLMLGHGMDKLADLLFGITGFPDPIGIGSTPTLALAAMAEIGCSLLVIIGFRTRIAALSIVAAMLIAGFVVHIDDGSSGRELALLYAIPFLTLVFTGGGRYTLDTWLESRRRSPHRH